MKEILSIVLADSAADSKFKTQTKKFQKDNPNHDCSTEYKKDGGEKQIYLKNANDPIINEFDNINVKGYFFTKSDILSYLKLISEEFKNPQQTYINEKFLNQYYDELIEKATHIDRINIFHGKIKRDSVNRGYLQMPNENLRIYHNLVQFCLPIVTKYFFIKHQVGSSIYIQIRPMLNYKSQQYADVLNRMIKASPDNILGAIHAFTYIYAEAIEATQVELSDIIQHLTEAKGYEQAISDSFKTYRYLKSHNISLNPSEIIDEVEFTEPSEYKGDLTPVILYGPPGTGKTHSLKHDYLKKFNDSVSFFTTFHQSFSYEEFVEGLKPILGDSSDVSYRIEKGAFYKACEKAAILAGYNSLSDALKATAEDRTEKFKKAMSEKKLVLLCIDEINRGNVAAIFGDLISLIEPSKRLGNKEELILMLPYSKQKFGVPANLMIVGTMNTADRSIQLLDSALRRRFRFLELLPKYEIIKNERARKVLEAINKRIRGILNKDAQIGHSYFIDVEDDISILSVIANKIIPLLEEYFYNDVEKIRFVLNDIKDKGKFYIEDEDAKNAYVSYTEYIDINADEKSFYIINDEIYNSDSSKASDFVKQIIG